jgi:hypothetical protein
MQVRDLAAFAENENDLNLTAGGIIHQNILVCKYDFLFL